ncbi:MAG: hypothetical protein RL641_801, partial [Candidatus Parcubacteria bacterium]
MQTIKKTISGFVAILVMAAFPIPSLAAGAPTITTLSATAPTSTAVTLNGFFNANGATTSTWFKYGTNATNLSSTTNPVNQGSGTGSFSAPLTGLTPNTTYFFRAYGSNFYGQTIATSTLSFTTQAGQVSSLTVQTLSASNITSSTATLNGHYTMSGVSSTVWFQYGTNIGNLTTLTNPQLFNAGNGNYSANISGLTPGTTYYFYAYGSQAGHIVSATNLLQFTTAPAPVSQTSMTVATIAPVNITHSTAEIRGYVTMTNTIATSRYFKFGTSATNLSLTLSVPGQQTSFGMFSGTVSNLLPHTTYYYRAYAVNSAGVTVPGSSTLQFTTSSAPQPNPVYACNDGIDNDGDGLVDQADPGCTSATDNNEYNYVPTPVVYACNDGIDNDGDGLTDQADPGCTSATDNNEYNYVNNGSAPNVTTGPANNVFQTGATLTGNVDANNSPTYYWFTYGTNGSLNNSTSQMYFGTSNGNVNQSIGNLQSNTTYSYKVCASNSYGSNCGNVLTFTTPQAPCTNNCGGCTSN